MHPVIHSATHCLHKYSLYETVHESPHGSARSTACLVTTAPSEARGAGQTTYICHWHPRSQSRSPTSARPRDLAGIWQPATGQRSLPRGRCCCCCPMRKIVIKRRPPPAPDRKKSGTRVPGLGERKLRHGAGAAGLATRRNTYGGRGTQTMPAGPCCFWNKGTGWRQGRRGSLSLLRVGTRRRHTRRALEREFCALTVGHPSGRVQRGFRTMQSKQSSHTAYSGIVLELA